MRKSQYTRATLELQLQRTVVRSTAITKIFKYLFSAGATAATAWFIYLSIDSLAGDDTNATINVVFDILKIARLQRLSLGYLE